MTSAINARTIKPVGLVFGVARSAVEQASRQADDRLSVGGGCHDNTEKVNRRVGLRFRCEDRRGRDCIITAARRS